MIFVRLKAQGLDWQYAFPKLQVIRFQKPEAEGKEWENYNPSQSFAEEEEEREHTRLEAELEAAHQESLEAAKKLPPPHTVTAYQAVYGHDPHGWPPWDER